MTAPLRYSFLSALLLALLSAGCGDSVQPGSAIFSPAGKWRYTATDPLLGTTTRSQLAFDALTGSGTIVDTITSTAGGDDSIVSYRFRYTTVNEGYQRMILIRGDSTAPADTSLGYWYFYRRGDTLLYYTGMRFVGNGVGLEGVWESAGADVGLTGEHCRLEFSEQSVKILHTQTGGTGTTRTLPYTALGDSLGTPGDPCIAGDRYEINPGFALYITTRATRRYLPLR